MHRTLLTLVIVTGLASAMFAAPPDTTEPAAAFPTPDEARGRAELLHDALGDLLQVVHHEYYRLDEGLTLPAAAFRTVFADVARKRKVELRWLAVNAPPMNVDHKAGSEFEQQAVKALASGAEHFERIEDGVYRRAARIMLESECLKCHVPNRRSTEARIAALVISLPIRGN
jgi:hypothetical protein